MTDGELNTSGPNKGSGPNEEAKTTPGTCYVAEYLPDLGDHADPDWIAESVDGGRLRACPRCQFLHLPQRPFPMETIRAHPGQSAEERAAMCSCDVCADMAARCEEMGYDIVAMLPNTLGNVKKAEQQLEEERLLRANCYFHLGPCGGFGSSALLAVKLNEFFSQQAKAKYKDQ